MLLWIPVILSATALEGREREREKGGERKKKKIDERRREGKGRERESKQYCAKAGKRETMFTSEAVPCVGHRGRQALQTNNKLTLPRVGS